MRPRQLVWLLLLVLVGAIVAIERTDFLGSQPDGDGHGEREVRMLLPVPVEELGAVEITHAGAVYRFERDETGAWYHHAHGDAGAEAQHVHQTDSAAAERIEAAFAAFGRTRIERQLEPSEHTGDYGVTEPDMVIAIYRQFEPQPLAGYAVGHVAPDTVSRYVMTVDSSAVVTIPNYQIENLLALIEAAGAHDARDHEWATPTSR